MSKIPASNELSVFFENAKVVKDDKTYVYYDDVLKLMKESNIKIGIDKLRSLLQDYCKKNDYSFGQPPRKILKPNIPDKNNNKTELYMKSSEKDIQMSMDFHDIKPRYTMNDLGGLDKQKKDLFEWIKLPLVRKETFEILGVKPIRGILVNGPSGCGKSKLVECVVGSIIEDNPNVNYFKISGSDIVSLTSSSTSAKVSLIFEKVENNSPAILFVDDLDSVSGKRFGNDYGKSIYHSLCKFLDRITESNTSDVVIIGATVKADRLPSEIRRIGRFSVEISLGIPDKNTRKLILEKLIRDVKFDEFIPEKFDCKLSNTDDSYSLIERISHCLAEHTEGYIGADLYGVIQSAAINCVKRSTAEGEKANLSISYDDIRMALKTIQPSLRREGFTTLPHISFNSIGGLEAAKLELMTIIDTIKNPDKYKLYNLKPSCGAILHGPPGCGKTLLARAVATAADNAAFISVKGPEIINKYLGESESAIRDIFNKAKDSAPCVIFFDEIDAICPRRTDDHSNSASSRVVNQLLTVLDGAEDRGRVFVLGATNRIDMIDEAILRPGRFDKIITIDLPKLEDRKDILNKIFSRFDQSILDLMNFDELSTVLSNETDGFSGADLEAIVREAAELSIQSNRLITKQDFISALEKIKQHKTTKHIM